MEINKGSKTEHGSRARRFFWNITASPNWALVIGLFIVLATGAGLTKLAKDTSVNAFIPDDHASLAAQQKAERIFGLNDPFVIAVDTGKVDGVYSAEVLTVIHDLQNDLLEIPNVRTDRVTSLLTENALYGADDVLMVDAIGGEPPYDATFAARAKKLVALVPPYLGTLVAKDGSAAVIVAELIDQHKADKTYDAVMALAANYRTPGIAIHVAGQGAVGGFLSEYIDRDSRKMQPIMVAVILLVLMAAFMRAKALLGPLLVIAGGTVGAIGLMAWLGVSYYAITSALPVVLLSIAVADSIHVLTAYYELRASHPDWEPRETVVEAMVDMWIPITLTTITTTAGFIGLSAASIMPPIKHFGTFAAIGVVIAWIFTVFVLPSAILKLKLDRSPVVRPSGSPSGVIAKALTSISLSAATYPLIALLGFISLTSIALYAAQGLKIDRSQVENFQEGEPIRLADHLINEKFAGTSYLDVIIEASEPEGLLDAEKIGKVAALQAFMERQPFVMQTVSIADYLALMHHALVVDAPPGALPESGAAIAQYLLLYESAGDPTDFEEEIDQQYQSLLVRGYMNANYYSQKRGVVKALEEYLAQEFEGSGMTATISGRVNIQYHWMNSLADSHFRSVAIALALVWLASCILFRSVFAGLMATLPVMLTTIGIYGLMAMRGIYLEPATSMFAAISIGVGVDFAIHLIDRMKLGMIEGDGTVLTAIRTKFPHAARACFFNAAALGLGFCVPMVSELPTLQRFGALVAFACLISFLAALVLVPMAWALAERFQTILKKTSVETGV